MLKNSLLAAICLTAGVVVAAPFLQSSPYPVTGVQPDSVSMRINGGAPIPCTLVVEADGALTPKCDLASLTVAGTYTITMTVVKADIFATSNPFTYTLVPNNQVCTTTCVPQIAPYSVWADSTIPGTPSSGDTGAVTLGVKFKVSVAGTITAIRFYKGTGNTGLHYVSMWTAAGQSLYSSPVATESASGWQTVGVFPPVAVAANTVYVASYFAPVGRYAVDLDYFLVTGRDMNSIHILKDGESGGNGVFAYGTASTFPTGSFRSANYWVDVVFKPN